MKAIQIGLCIIMILVTIPNMIIAKKENNDHAFYGWFCAMLWTINSMIRSF